MRADRTSKRGERQEKRRRDERIKKGEKIPLGSEEECGTKRETIDLSIVGSPFPSVAHCSIPLI